MHLTLISVALFGVFSSAFASTLVARQVPAYPACAEKCIASTPLSGCVNTTDFKCLCTNTAFLTASALCIGTACTGDDLTTAHAAAAGRCLEAGITLPGADTTSPSASAASASSPPSSASAGAPTSSGAALTSGQVNMFGLAAVGMIALAL